MSVKICVSHSVKVPHPAAEFGSIGASVSIEGTPPNDMSREDLIGYTRALLQEARSRTEEHLAQQSPLATRQHSAHRPARHRHQPIGAPRGRPGRNGHNGSPASQKQLLFIRSLSREVGLSQEDLANLVEDLCETRSLNVISKSGASSVIEALQARSHEGPSHA